ncbi:GumC family protein [Roseobacter sp.]|uniref:GumC family protein n=1 Tax=Roseobacter sp. TaxID=1907202 RepID=UPI003859458D
MKLNKTDQAASYPVTMMQAPGIAASDDDDRIDLRTLFTTLWRGKWIVMITTLIAIVLGVLVVSQMEPTYRASAKVMFDIQQTNVVNIQEVLVDQQFDASKLEDQIEVLRSTKLIERVIEELALDEDPEFNPSLRVHEPTILERIGLSVAMPPELTDFAMNVGLIAPPPPTPEASELARQERLQVINNVLEGIELTPVGRSRVIEISFVSDHPRTAARVVNTIAEQYIVDQLEAKLEATRAATSWLSARVDELQERVQLAEDKVEAARVELSDETGQTLAVTRQQLEALNGSLASFRAEASRLASLYNRLTSAVEENRDLGAISEFRASNLIQTYREERNELLGQKVVLESSVREGHPALVRLMQQISEVERNISDEARRIVSAAELDLRGAQAQETSLESEVRRLEQKALQQSRNEVQLRQLDREAEASRVLYENFLGRLQETSEQEDLQEADARVLSPAEQPLLPEGQAKTRVLMLATILGGIVGIGIVFLLDRLNNTFRTPNQLEDLSGENVLGVLPALGNRTKRSDIIKHLREKPSSSLAESIRNLRTSILFSNIDKTPKVVMFTSSIPREGKSTSSMLVAMTSRQMGKSAIIVDCDLRLPVLARLLNAADGKPGLISVLEGTSPVNEAIFKDPDTGLHVLMTRSSQRASKINAADALSSKKFQDLIQELSKIYDLVILDTPPTLVVTDARIISKLVDAVVYAVRWDSTPRGAVMEGLKELKSIDAPIAGVVMTMINEDKASRYSYEGYSYYKGQYKDYYGS